MGTGKSTIGKLAAERLGMAFVDTDEVIVERAGKAISEIFAQEGEPAFRKLEAEVCLEIGGGSGQVIGLGGGALLNEKVREAYVARNLVICLTCDLDEIVRRVGDDPSRPLFVADRVAALLASRAEHYNSLPHCIDTTPLSPEQVVEEVVRLWENH